MRLATRTRTFVLTLAIMLLASLLVGCIDLDDHTSTVYDNSPPAYNPYGEQILLHEQVDQTPTLIPRR